MKRPFLSTIFFLIFFFTFSFANAQDESIRTFKIHVNDGKVGSICSSPICFSPDGKHIATGNDDASIYLFDIENEHNLKIFKGHSEYVTALSFSPDGEYLASAGGLDQTIKLWNTSKGQIIKTFKGHNGSVSSLCFSPNGKYIVTGSDDNTIKLWNVSSGQNIRTLIGTKSRVTSVCFSPDGKQIASSESSGESIKLWDVLNGNNIKTYKKDYHSGNSVSFSPDGKFLISADLNGNIKLWNVSNGQNIKTFGKVDEHVYSISFSPNGKYFASAAINNKIKLWNVSSGQNVKTFSGHSKQIYSVCFSPDGKHIASASDDRTIKLWDARTFDETIKDFVINSIENWQQKGEFENLTDYALRVSEENRKQKIAQFQKQCIDELALAEERKIYASYKNFNLQKYDADAETYLIDANTYGNIILKVSLDNAPQFKEKWNTVTIANPHFEFTGEEFVLTHLDFVLPNSKTFSYDISTK